MASYCLRKIGQWLYKCDVLRYKAYNTPKTRSLRYLYALHSLLMIKIEDHILVITINYIINFECLFTI